VCLSPGRPGSGRRDQSYREDGADEVADQQVTCREEQLAPGEGDGAEQRRGRVERSGPEEEGEERRVPVRRPLVRGPALHSAREEGQAFRRRPDTRWIMRSGSGWMAWTGGARCRIIFMLYVQSND
jgi:hypothetical protein